MSLEIELREVDCAKRSSGEAKMKTRNAATKKYGALALPVRGSFPFWPPYPVYQQIARISSLLPDENTIRIQSLAPKQIVAQSGDRRTVTGIVTLAWRHEKNRA